MYCSKCGVQIADDAAFCSKCGNKILREPEVEAPQITVAEEFKAPVDREDEFANSIKSHEIKHQNPTVKSMLARPEFGWTDFQLEGTSIYVLSYVDDIAAEWLDQAIMGLSTMKPFCVKGFMEPGRVLCTVSYWNCHVIAENDGNDYLEQKDVELEYSHTSMLDFCKYLYDDISSSLDQWADFTNRGPAGVMQHHRKKSLLKKKLATLGDLIAKREEAFRSNRAFY